MNYNLAQPFFENSEKCPQNTAISVGGRAISYWELRKLVQPVASWLQQRTGGHGARVGILASRSVETFSGILGTCWAGGTYVPLSPKLPEERLLQFLERTELHALIVDRDSHALLTERVQRKCPKNVLTVEKRDSESHSRVDCVVETMSSVPIFNPKDQPVNVTAEHSAYIEFTSGTTGVPKGVTIPTGAVAHFLAVMRKRYDVGPADRIAGVAETTFDLSVFDMFMSWSCGAGLYVVPATQVMAPIDCIQRNRVTLVLTVPFVAVSMKRMKFLSPGSMPDLRYTLFAGEPLPVAAALAWQQAAPNSIIENVYGPTEATVVCTGQRFTGAADATPSRGVVPIGTAFPGMEVAIVDSGLQFVTNEQPGEIVISGPQLSSGYFRDPEQSAARFPILQGKVWYRTGDLGYHDAFGTFHHLGRIDNQVKVRGMRVELEDVEAHLREVYGTDSVAAVAWPVQDGSAAGIVAFIGGQACPSDSTQIALLKGRLPVYMTPTAIHHVDAIPLTANGKINRQDLISRLERKSA